MRTALLALLLFLPGCFDSPLAAYLEEQRLADTPGGIAWTRMRRGATPADVREAAALARANGRTPIAYIKASWCSACKLYERALEEPDVIRGHRQAHVIEFDLDWHRRLLRSLGGAPRAVPTFAHLHAETDQITSRQITSRAFGDGIGPAMARFVGPGAEPKSLQ